MTALADCLHRIVRAKRPETADERLDREAVFVHPSTIDDLFIAGRLFLSDDAGCSEEPIYFAASDREYPGKRVCGNDTLAPGRVYRRISPEPLANDDFAVVKSTTPDGKPTITLSCPKADMGVMFEAGTPKQDMLEHFRDVYQESRARYLPCVPPAIAVVQFHD